MAEQKESSVLFSLKELMSIEENRIREEEDAKKRAAEAEVQARLDSERRAREEEEARLRSEEERRRQEDLRRKMEEAQIEAAKAAEIEKRRLEEQHRLQMEALAKQQAHEREIVSINAQKRKGLPPAALAGIGVGVLAAIFAIVFLVAIKPANDAKEAVKKAEIAAASDDEASWAEADRWIAVARDKDPTNKDVAAVESKVADKRKKIADAKAAADAEMKANYQKLQKELSDAQAALASAKTDAEKQAAQDKLNKASAAVKAAGGGGGGAPAAKPPKVCPPGVPLCN
jgi:colicin import membrane protein